MLEIAEGEEGRELGRDEGERGSGGRREESREEGGIGVEGVGTIGGCEMEEGRGSEMGVAGWALKVERGCPEGDGVERERGSREGEDGAASCRRE